MTENEKKVIKNNMKDAGFNTLTNYIRKMAINGRVIHIDFTSLKDSLNETGQYVYELNKIGTNLNQIALKLNQTDIVEQEDIQFLLSEFKKMQSNYQASQKILLDEIRKITRSE